MKTSLQLLVAIAISLSMVLLQSRVSVPHLPRNLEECNAELKCMLSHDLIEQIRSGIRSEVLKYHLTLGMRIRNEWGLWTGSKLARWFNDHGVMHPDEMSALILLSFWDHLQGQPDCTRGLTDIASNAYPQTQTVRVRRPG